MDMGEAFHREVHNALNQRFRTELAIQRMIKEMDLSEPLARSLVLREPLKIDNPNILVPYVQLALPEGTLSSLRTIDYAGRNLTQPVVRVSLSSRDITSFISPETSVDLSSDSDPLETAEMYLNLCRSKAEEDPHTQDLVVLTRHQQQNARTIQRCIRSRTNDGMPYRPQSLGPFGVRVGESSVFRTK